MPSLNWIGRDAVERHHTTVPFHLLKADPKLSVGDVESGNLLVEGDNLVALKALLPYYAGQVKCIYIDPPYNTGNENWVYNDSVNSPQMREWLGKVVGGETEDLSRHDKWLCMMYPRLVVLRQFLHREGMIFVSIDDVELHHLRLLMNEIFGESNWFATLTRRAMHTVRNSSKDFNLNTDYVLVYAKNKEWHGIAKERYIRIPMDKTESYPFDDGDGQGRYKLDPLSARNYYEPYTYVFRNGVEWSAPEGSYPRYAQESLAEMDEAGEIVFTGNEPKAKRYLKDVQEGRPPDALLKPEDVRFNSTGTTLLRRMLGGGAFTQPKPIELIKFLVTLVKDKNAIILDSFAGSGTTGHTLLQLNNEDGGNRRFILVELEEEISRNVTARRLQLAIQGFSYKDNKGRNQSVEGLGGGFQYCTLGPTLFDAGGRIRDEVSFDELARFVYFKETGTALPRRANGKTALLGVHNDTAIYLLYNGVLKDKSANGGNALTRKVLVALPPHSGPKVIYGTRCLLGEQRLRRVSVSFRHIPTDLPVE